MSKTRDGFTLIELIIVIVVIGVIVLAAAQSKVGNLASTYSLDSAVIQVKAEINAQRNLALQTNLLRKIVFVDGTRTMSFYSQSTSQDSWVYEGQNAPLSTGITLSTNLTSDVLIFSTLGEPYIGTPTALPSGSLTDRLIVHGKITMTFSTSETQVLRVIPYSGIVIEPIED